MAHCNRCNRQIDMSRDSKTGKRKRKRAHVCPTVVIQDKVKDEATQSLRTRIVHEDRVERGGDLYKHVTGKKASAQVVFRNRQKIEKLADRSGKKKTKKGEKELVAPSGELLLPPEV